jgi:hypothetical protein
MTIQIKEVNCTTGEEIIRDANAEELAQMELDVASAIVLQAEAEAKATARTSAMEKLSALGLTTEEIAALTK